MLLLLLLDGVECPAAPKSHSWPVEIVALAALMVHAALFFILVSIIFLLTGAVVLIIPLFLFLNSLSLVALGLELERYFALVLAAPAPLVVESRYFLPLICQLDLLLLREKFLLGRVLGFYEYFSFSPTLDHLLVP